MRKCNDKNQPAFNINHKHPGIAPSSFNMHNSESVFQTMKIEKGSIFVDLGCGAGEYSIYASRIIGHKGQVYAIDMSQEILNKLSEIVIQQKRYNIKLIKANICLSIPLKENSVDQCLLATVMHAQKFTQEHSHLFSEIARILKPNGQLTLIECKKEEMPFGPPLHMKISASELEEKMATYYFKKTGYMDLGYNYMMTFEKVII